MTSSVQLIDDALIEATIQRASASERGRVTHNFHQAAADNPHRFLNALTRGSYCAPHRHASPPKTESFLVLRGEVLLLLFGDAGEIQARYVLGRNELIGIDIPAGVWHTVAAVTPTAVCFEVKPGPWEPHTDKQFAPWAPPEGDPRALPLLERWLEEVAG